MAKKKENLDPEPEDVVLLPTPAVKILPLSVDYPSEGLNNMARKINEIIDHIYG